MSTFVTCPTCGAKVKWSDHQPWRPFCSERCRLIDLGKWAGEEHRIPGDETLPAEHLDDSDQRH